MASTGRVAFVTGAASGFGRAFVRALCADGASTVVADIDAKGAEVVAAGLRAEGHSAIAVPCDVAVPNEVDAAVARAIAEFGGINILINNAGKHLQQYNQPFTVLGREEARRLFDVNVMGTVNCPLACHESMRARGGGVVVNISSMAAYNSATPYGVSKLAVRGLTIAFGTEFADANIRVNGIAPGFIVNEATERDFTPAQIDDYVQNQQLVHRHGSIDDVVAAMRFLCDSTFITGETLRVAGGARLAI